MRLRKLIWLSIGLFATATYIMVANVESHDVSTVDFSGYYSIELRGVPENLMGLYFEKYPGYELKNGLLAESNLNFYREGMLLDELSAELSRLKSQFRHGYAVGLYRTEERIKLAFRFSYIDAVEERGYIFTESTEGIKVAPIGFKEYKPNEPSDGYQLEELPIPPKSWVEPSH